MHRCVWHKKRNERKNNNFQQILLLHAITKGELRAAIPALTCTYGILRARNIVYRQYRRRIIKRTVHRMTVRDYIIIKCDGLSFARETALAYNDGASA